MTEPTVYRHPAAKWYVIYTIRFPSGASYEGRQGPCIKSRADEMVEHLSKYEYVYDVHVVAAEAL